MLNPKKIDFIASKCDAGIILIFIGHVMDFSQRIRFINVYTPYKYQKYFWEILAVSGIIDLDSLIIVVDLKFSLGSDEIWGNRERVDPLSNFFSGLIEAHDLIHIYLPHLG